MKQTSNIYYQGFVASMEYACQAARFLNELSHDYQPGQLETKALELHKIEHAADLAKHELMEKLAKEFITPIEREDIMLLFQQIDDITDSIEDVLRKMYMYNVQQLRPEMREFTELIHQCCVVTTDAVRELPNFQKSERLRGLIIKVNELEEAGDRLHCTAMRRLFTQNCDPLERITWTEMFEWLERCCDKCEDVTDSIEMVMLKNS